MGLLSKALRLVSKISPIVPGVGGVVARGAGLLAKIGLKTPRLAKAGAGLAAGGAAFELGGRAVRGRTPRAPALDQYGRLIRRSRRRGLSGRDIQGAQRVAMLVRSFGYRPKVQRRKHRR